MLDPQYLRENKTKALEGLRKRYLTDDVIALVDKVILLDDERKAIQAEGDQLNAKMNAASRQIGELFREGKREEAELLKNSMAELKETIRYFEDKGRKVKSEIEEVLLSIPNIPHISVPPGKGEEDNEVYLDWPEDLPVVPKGALPHWEIAEDYNIIDFKLGAKITGSGFPLFRGLGARLSRALIQFFLNEAVAAGYEEIAPPLIVNEDSARATGQLPDKEGQMYHVTEENFYLIPTAEVPVTNILRDIILEADQLPVKFTGYTPCFRREAGSYGSDVKGLNRVHQFDKVEIVQIAHPDQSYQVLEEMVEHVQMLMAKLELPYRILSLCGGDLGFTSALTYDFEVYSAAQEKWLEVSSVSNFETFQAQRLQLRFREEGARKTQYVHTLNGSALALARIIAALLENNQTEEGIIIPKVLRPFMGVDIITK
jgi:seryl-tRNA synthetase